jgi:ABC-type antimicrobial peptide transport system permease subunit
MMTSYFKAFLRENKVKVMLLVMSMAAYFALVTVAFTLQRSIPEIAALPLKGIGVQTIVQKEGEIPERMSGAIFPHSNAPIGDGEYRRLKGLGFVQGADMGLYFWYFGERDFKAVLGVEAGSAIFAAMLKRNVLEGEFRLGGKEVLVTSEFAGKNGLAPGDAVALGGDRLVVRGVLRPNPSGNVIPADVYMDIDEAVRVARESDEMKALYEMGGERFGNVVLLQTDPDSKADREGLIKAIDARLIVFSEKTFTGEIMEQLRIVSASGRAAFALLGAVLAVAFGIMVAYNIKTREGEIAILRMIGWKVADLRRHFIGESLVLLLAALAIGNVLALIGLRVLGGMTVSMELPWDISARPHFLPGENAIERVVTSSIPIHYDPLLVAALSAGFLLVFLAISLVLFGKLGKIKPYEHGI